jgi:hypothetical protein
VDDRQGCLAGLLEMLFVTAIFDWLEERFGFGRGCSCTGCGCGVLILIVFIIVMCKIAFGTNWFKIFGF